MRIHTLQDFPVVASNYGSMAPIVLGMIDRPEYRRYSLHSVTVYYIFRAIFIYIYIYTNLDRCQTCFPAMYGVGAIPMGLRYV